VPPTPVGGTFVIFGIACHPVGLAAYFPENWRSFMIEPINWVSSGRG